jgi:UDP-GlcNAc3NAcA epimerase
MTKTLTGLGGRPPHYRVGMGSGSHGEQTGRMMSALEPVVRAEAPDWVLVYGDTNTTMAAALVASKCHVKVAHVEAGLRSFNRRMPEEIDRIVADHVSDLLPAQTDRAGANLAHEGVPLERIRQVGDVMFDLATLCAPLADARAESLLSSLGLTPSGFILSTVHRAENTDDSHRLLSIFRGLCRGASMLPVVVVLHPRTAEALACQDMLNEVGACLRIVDPIGYLDMVALQRNAAAIATDSGGLQKEAFFHGKPCVTLRDETEWVELIELGWNRLAPPGSADTVGASIVQAIQTRGVEAHPYGAGDAARSIARLLGDIATADGDQ